ncbi:hypothetical protein [Streptomyces anulatus]|uniref:hypothetical protein n=1 Tax=Streptomyces anulatus TaxID=1892 RepID=UPI00365540CD
MPYLIPPRTPLTPMQAERGFDYLLALQMGSDAAVAGRAQADPELAFVLLRLAEDIIWPVTAVDEESTDPCADSFALDKVGCALLSALRDWARDSPTTAAPGIARSIIRFTVNVIPDPEHPDTADTPGGDARRAPGARPRGALRTRCAPSPSDAHRDAHHRPLGALHPVGVLRRA